MYRGIAEKLSRTPAEDKGLAFGRDWSYWHSISGVLGLLFLMAIGLILAGCEVAPGGTGQDVDLPRVDLECRTPSCLAQTGPRDYYFTITMSGCDPSHIDFARIATAVGNGICVSGNGCTATITNWIDADSQPIDEIPSGFYSVCAIFDLNGNYAGFADSGDSEVDIDGYLFNGSEAVVTLDAWEDVP